MKIDELKYDILKEMFNVGVGKSAAMLAEIVNKKIVLTVPHIELIDKKCHQDQCFPIPLPQGTLVVSSITFREKLAGNANLIFPANKMRQFLNLCQGEEPGSHEAALDFDDIDLDIIKEVGNIILNSIVGEMGNFLRIDLNYSLPRVKLFEEEAFDADVKEKDLLYRLMLYINFIIADTEIKGAIIIDLTINSLHELMKNLEKIEDELL